MEPMPLVVYTPKTMSRDDKKPKKTDNKTPLPTLASSIDLHFDSDLDTAIISSIDNNDRHHFIDNKKQKLKATKDYALDHLHGPSVLHNIQEEKREIKCKKSCGIAPNTLKAMHMHW